MNRQIDEPNDAPRPDGARAAQQGAGDTAQPDAGDTAQPDAAKTAPDGGDSGVEVSASSRRAFVGSVVRKAAFVIPAVWTITAQQAQAAGSKASANGPSCIAAGQPCTQNSDCCSGFCLGTMMCMA